MSKTNNKQPRYRKFFIKTSDTIITIVAASFFRSLSRQEALGVGVQTYLELQQQMVRDAKSSSTERIGTISICDGLLRSLHELERHHPFLIQEICGTSRRVMGQRVYEA